MIRALCFVTTMALAMSASAGIKFSFNNEELTKMIETYSKATNQQFVIDPGVRGKGTITAADNVTNEEAFNLLSSMLAINGYAISKQGGTMSVRNARNVQRDLIETTNTLPALKPERMITYVITLKNVSVETLNRELRIIPSKDGEMSVFTPKNQIIITDWASNLHRIDAMLKEIDQPVTDAKVAKIVEESKKNRPPPFPSGDKAPRFRANKGAMTPPPPPPGEE